MIISLGFGSLLIGFVIALYGIGAAALGVRRGSEGNSSGARQHRVCMKTQAHRHAYACTPSARTTNTGLRNESTEASAKGSSETAQKRELTERKPRAPRST